MSKVTKEQAQSVSDLNAGYTLGHADVAILNELARMALAGMEAEPVAQVLSSRAGNDTSTIDKALPEGTMLYAAPQPLTTSERAEHENYRNAQQVVPGKLSREEYKRRFMGEENFDDTFRGGWNACRAAMLQGAENVESRCTIQTAPALDSSPKIAESRSSNSPVIPDGWVACSERMPEESGRYWCNVEEQNSLGKSCYQWNCSWNGDVWDGEMMYGRVTHWQPLPAAPQQEAVSSALEHGMARYSGAMQKLSDGGD